MSPPDSTQVRAPDAARRIALRTAAVAGFLLIVGQLGWFAFAASRDPSGTRRVPCVWQPPFLPAATVRLKVPNTWKRAESAPDSLRFELPGGGLFQISGTKSGLLKPHSPTDETPLVERAHRAGRLAAQASFAGYAARAAPAPSAVPFSGGLLELFTAGPSDEPVAGVRYTVVHAGAAWTVIASAPESSWDRARAVFAAVVRTMSATEDGQGKQWQ